MHFNAHCCCNACLKTIGYTRTILEEGGLGRLRTMTALCSRASNASILLTSLLTRLAGDHVVCIRRWLFASELAVESGKAPSRLPWPLPTSSGSGCRAWKSTVTRYNEKRASPYSLLYCDTDLRLITSIIFFYCTLIALSRSSMQIFVVFHCCNA